MSHKHISQIFILLLFLVSSLFAEAQSQGSAKEKANETHFFQKSRYIIHTGIDVLPGDETTSLRLQLVNGYQFTDNISAGLGIGFTYYNDPLSLLPIFLDVEYRLQNSTVSPFIFLKGGYNVSILTDTNAQVDSHRGGYMLNPGIGILFKTRSNTALYLDAGFNLDRSHFERDIFGDRFVETEISYKRFMFGVGLSF